MYDLVRKNLSGTLKYRKRDYDLKLVKKGYEVGDYAYKINFTTKTGAKALFPAWKAPVFVIESSHPLYKIEDHKGRQTTILHDQLKICRDRVIPLWLHRHRHDMLDLDVTIPYGLPEAEIDSPPRDCHGMSVHSSSL